MIYKEGNNDIDPTAAIVDTGCHKTVAGKPWLDSYIQSNNQNDNRLKFRRERNKFRFGNGPIYTSERSWKIEVNIGNLKTSIWVAFVDADIPLLLGIKLTGETFKVKTSRTNHWKIKLQLKTLHDEASNLVLNVEIAEISSKE